MVSSRPKFLCPSVFIICLAMTAYGCSTSTTKDSDSTTTPHWEWAFFDGDEILLGEYEDFYVNHRVLSIDGYDLTDGRTARVKNRDINCLLRDCRLHPGQHEIYVGYSWASSAAKDKHHASDTLKDVGLALSFPIQILVGMDPIVPSGGGPSYKCQVTLTIEVQPKYHYMLKVIHNSQEEKPDQIQIVDVESGAVVASNTDC